MQEKKILSILVLATAALSLVIVSSIDSTSVFAQQPEKFRAKLQGKTEVPPVVSTGAGKVQIKVKDDGITSKINLTGITESNRGTHIFRQKRRKWSSHSRFAKVGCARKNCWWIDYQRNDNPF
jgi:hypothetical protein